MVIAWILLIVVALILCAGVIFNFLWSCALTDRELELDKQEVSLEEREIALKKLFIDETRK